MKLMLNQPLSIDCFTHNKSDKTFCAEASDFGNYNFFQRIYDDACDCGFCVVNPRINQSVLLLFEKTIEHTLGSDLEVVGWQFVPSDEDIRNHVGLKDYRFFIYND